MKKFLPSIKKFLPFILLGVGLFFVVGAIIFVKSRSAGGAMDDTETALRDVSFDERPVASLTPTEDGHWLNLKVEKLLSDAAIMDYELLYRVADGRTQGVPGSIKLDGLDEVARELLLGSESSGKYRYDEGVKEGTLTLRFRTEKGKLIAKFSTDFVLLAGSDELVSLDGKLAVTPEKSDGFYIIMETFGVPNDPPASVSETVYGVFASNPANGKVQMTQYDTLYRWDGSIWEKVSDATPAVGIFVKAK